MCVVPGGAETHPGRRSGRDGYPSSAPRSHSPGEAAMRVDVTVDISAPPEVVWALLSDVESWPTWTASITAVRRLSPDPLQVGSDRKSTRLNSSHANISYAVFCLKKKK